MEIRVSYNTSNRTKIIEYLENNKDRVVTVADISEYLEKCNSNVNITTIYRFLDKLIQDKKVIKYSAENGKKATFQYVGSDNHCNEHLHIKCVECGKIEHLECDFMKELSEHIEGKHGYTIQCENSIIYGVCEKCR